MTQKSTISSFIVPAFLDGQKPLCAEVDPELFFPQEMEVGNSKSVPISVYKDVAAAKKICYNCPLISGCLQYALTNQEIGIWGGTTERQRDQLRRRNRAHSRIQ